MAIDLGGCLVGVPGGDVLVAQGWGGCDGHGDFLEQGTRKIPVRRAARKKLQSPPSR